MKQVRAVKHIISGPRVASYLQLYLSYPGIIFAKLDLAFRPNYTTIIPDPTWAQRVEKFVPYNLSSEMSTLVHHCKYMQAGSDRGFADFIAIFLSSAVAE
jgi:hypothetical protein